MGWSCGVHRGTICCMMGGRGRLRGGRRVLACLGGLSRRGRGERGFGVMFSVDNAGVFGIGVGGIEGHAEFGFCLDCAWAADDGAGVYGGESQLGAPTEVECQRLVLT